MNVNRGEEKKKKNVGLDKYARYLERRVHYIPILIIELTCPLTSNK